MGLRGISSLAILLMGVGTAAGAATATATARPEITVFRCQDAAGKVSLRDTPCPADSKETTRQMLRPQDPAPRPSRAEPEPRGAPAPAPAPAAAQVPPPAPWFPPPPLFQCTDFDGAVRFTESGHSNTRCVPLSVLGWNVRRSPIGAASCRWVTESCVRLSDNGACGQYRTMLVRARSDSLHAFSNTAAFRRSEVQRLDQIVRVSCR